MLTNLNTEARDERFDKEILVETFCPKELLDVKVTNISNILEERGSRYGSFIGHSVITQKLKRCMASTPKWEELDMDMKESLEMIAHKIGRILNGDPKYADSWVDIAGYSKLVADRLES